MATNMASAEECIIAKHPKNGIVCTLPYDMDDRLILDRMAELRKRDPSIEFEMHLEPVAVAA